MKTKALFVGLAAATLVLAACSPEDVSSSPDVTDDSSSTVSTPTETPSSSPTTEGPWAEYDPYTVAEIIDMCADYTSSASTERFYVAGTMGSLTNATYGAFELSDETDTIEVYGSYSEDGTLRYSEMSSVPVPGDEVLLYGTIQTFKGTPEIASGWIIDWVSNAEPVDPDGYELVDIATARKAEDGEIVKTKGIVLNKTYNISMNEVGFLIADTTGSIYVYDAKAVQLAIGDEVTLIGTKDYWILDSQLENAQTNGYKGANQITSITILDKTSDVAYDIEDFATDTTIRDVLAHEFTEDITGTLYKAASYIHRADNGSYVNYYLNDLDGTTGTYTYTQANGADFSWLDPYDGKVVYVYFFVINASMTASGGLWRFLPVSVSEQEFTFAEADAPKLAVDYYGLTQFLDTYAASPDLVVKTTVDLTVVGISGVTLAYSSSDETVAYFETTDDGLVFKTGEDGSTTITVTATYGEYTYSGTKLVTVGNTQVETSTVAEAIAAPVAEDDYFYLRGRVGPGIPNLPGCYIIDETGIISARFESYDAMEGLTIGDEVILYGSRTMWSNTQIVFAHATVYANLYGNAPYSTASFTTGMNLTEVVAAASSDNTANAYVVEGVTFSCVASQYYTNYYLNYDGTQIQLYAGNGATSYGWLADYVDAGEFTCEVAVCNWNGKAWRAVLLSFVDADGVTHYNQNNLG